jgi:proline iminopeptidase
MPPIPPPTSSGFTTTTEVPLYWASWGMPGATRLLVLHGGPGAHHDYLLPQMLRVAERCDRELLFYDQRGGGRSKTDDRSPITWRTLVADLERVIAELMPAGAPTIIGYSWGGLLALLYSIEAAAGRARPLPARLVLIDPAPATRQYRAEFEAEFAKRMRNADIERMRQELASSGMRERDPEVYKRRAFELSVAGYFADPRESHDLTPFRVTGRVQQSVWDSLGDFDLLAPGQLDTVKVPTLVVHGRQDPIPVASSEGIARALGARLVILDGSGHVPYVETPGQLFTTVDSFLAICP